MLVTQMSIIYTKRNYYCCGWQRKVSTTVHLADAINLIHRSNKGTECKTLKSTARPCNDHDTKVLSTCPRISYTTILKKWTNHRYIQGINKVASIQHSLIIPPNTCSNTSLRQQHNVSEQKQRNENSSQNTSTMIPKLYKSSNSYAIRYQFEIPFKIVKYKT